MAHKMSPEEIREFLAHGTRTGKLATVRANGAPHVAPVWFVLDGDDLVFNTGARAGQTIYHVHAHVLAGDLHEAGLGA